MTTVLAPASSRALRGFSNSACSKSSLAKIATLICDNFCSDIKISFECADRLLELATYGWGARRRPKLANFLWWNVFGPMRAIRPGLNVTARVRRVDNFRDLIAGRSARFSDRFAAGVRIAAVFVNGHCFLPSISRLKGSQLRSMANADKVLYPRHPVGFIGILCSYRAPERKGGEGPLSISGGDYQWPLQGRDSEELPSLRQLSIELDHQVT